MYVKQVRIVHYGPIDQLDIELPFENETPKPVVLVGENGTGKSIVLSHIVNGLISAKDTAYSDTPEVERGKVYKLRSGAYIKSGSDFYFARVDFEDGLFMEEIMLKRLKREYPEPHPEISALEIMSSWNKMSPDSQDRFSYNDQEKKKDVKELLSKRCVLFFPPNRFEEPAWLNEMNLNAQATYMDQRRFEGQTSRRLISYSPLHENQNWLFDVLFDKVAFESQMKSIQVGDDFVQLHRGYSGTATSISGIALKIIKRVMGVKHGNRFSVMKRHNRVLTVEAESEHIAPVFQLSTGETSLLDMFLSILRDFDLTGTQFSRVEEVRGVVVVDEIDLHLHAIHQYEILPGLMRMFPNVQFVVTTHSPLFVLGMNDVFGEQGFALYRLPSGNQISPEEFSEFGNAYQVFRKTIRFSDDIRTAVERAQKPVVFMEGATDIKYVRVAADRLGRNQLLEKIDLQDGGGAGNLKNIWSNLRRFFNSRPVPQRVLLLFDCESRMDAAEGIVFKKTIPMQGDHPIQKGIENLFAKRTLDVVQRQKLAFIDVDDEHTRTVRGETTTVPETCTVNKDEKTNLCDWLCKNGTDDDFQHFRVIFDLIEEVAVVNEEPG